MTELQKIASTSSIDLQPVGPLTERDHARLIDCLLQEIGSEAADILAEPVTNRDGSRTDWYGRGNGPALPLTALDAETAGDVRARLADIETQIEALAARLSASTHPDDRAMASALTHALVVPDAGFIYTLEGRPVLTAWGFSHASRPGYRGGLSKIAPLKQTASAPATAQYIEPAQVDKNTDAAEQPSDSDTRLAQARGCLPALLWLLFAFLVLAILFLLLRACAFGISIPLLNIGNCQMPARTAAIGEMQREITALEGQLLDLRNDCQTQGLVLVGPDSNAAGTTPDASIDSRLAERNAREGSLQISLVWDGFADLDLSLRCGAGHIAYNNREACGGALDIDSNDGRTVTAQPVENIVWTDQQSVPSGDVPIIVTLYNMRNERRTSIPYTVRIQSKNGNTVLSEKIINGTVDASMIQKPIIVGKLN